MIPKIIHYIWFGNKPKSKLMEVCLNTWHRILPEYEIKRWDESNIDLTKLCHSNKFLAKCVNLKLWAFVSDYIRLYVLYNFGGLYLDTDVEAVKQFDPLLNDECFFGYEADDYICTAVIGARKGHPTIKRILDFYDNEIWNVDFINNPIIFRYLQTKEPHYFEDCRIYPKDFFAPYDPDRSYTSLIENENTYAIHWYTANWNMSCRGYVFINTKHIKNKIYKAYQSMRKVVGYFRKRRQNR